MKRLTLSIICVVLITSVYANIEYNFIDLGSGKALSISSNSQYIVGTRTTTAWITNRYTGRPELREVQEPILYNPTGQGANLPLWGHGTAYSVNNSGQIVGESVNYSYGRSTPILYSPAGTGWNSVTLSYEGYSSTARSINNNGKIAGSVYPLGGGGDAVKFNYPYPPDYTYLGWTSGGAYAMNDNGQIVGYGRFGGSNAMLYSGGQSIILASSQPSGFGAVAYSINNSGQIVGVYNDSATLFDSSGNKNNISLGSGGAAYSINNMGQIVGVSYGGATLFDPTGHGNNINLNNVISPGAGWNLQSAQAISDNGWIVGYGLNPAGQSHAFLLIPIPEPATCFLFMLGGIILRKMH